MVQPLSQPPLRHSKSLQVAPEAQPAALLLVDIMTATGLPNLAAPQPDSEGRSGDFEGAQRVVCSLEFQDTLNSATSGLVHDLPLSCNWHTCAESLASQRGHFSCVANIQRAAFRAVHMSSVA